MIKIKLDNNEKIVTKGAYEEFYEHLGYKIVDDKKPFKKEVETKKEVEQDVEKKNNKGKLDDYSRK